MRPGSDQHNNDAPPTSSNCAGRRASDTDWLEDVVRDGAEQGQFNVDDQRPRDVVAQKVQAGCSGVLAVVGRAVEIPVVRQVLFAVLLSVFVGQILFGVLFAIGVRQILLAVLFAVGVRQILLAVVRQILLAVLFAVGIGSAELMAEH